MEKNYPISLGMTVVGHVLEVEPAEESCTDEYQDSLLPYGAVGYLRSSSGNGENLRDQRKKIEIAAAANSHEIDCWITDTTASLESFERNGLTRILSQSKNGYVKHLYISRFGCLSRSGQEFIHLMRDLSTFGIKVHFPSEPNILQTMVTTLTQLFSEDGLLLGGE